MVDNADSPSIPRLGAEFNEFLFAPIGMDGHGTYLTVVSALARLDLDPWAEAAKLARLPGAIAAQKLAELISKFPEIPMARQDPAKIALRLTALLPGRPRVVFPIIGVKPVAKAMAYPRSATAALMFAAGMVVVLLVFVSQFHHLHHAAIPPGNVHSIASNGNFAIPPVSAGWKNPDPGN